MHFSIFDIRRGVGQSKIANLVMPRSCKNVASKYKKSLASEALPTGIFSASLAKLFKNKQ